MKTNLLNQITMLGSNSRRWTVGFLTILTLFILNVLSSKAWGQCDISITISSASWGDGTTWQLRDVSNNVVLSGGPYGNGYNQTLSISNANNGPYSLVITSTMGDNMPNYSVSVSGTIQYSGTAPGNQTTTIQPITCGVAPPSGCGIAITISSASWGDGTTWQLRDVSNNVVLSGGPYGNGYNQTLSISNANNGPYSLVITSTMGDNMPNYSVSVNGTTQYSGTAPGNQTTTIQPITCGASSCVVPSIPSFGNNTWNVLGYNHGGYNFGNLGSLAGQTFRGFYTNSIVDITSTNQWCSTCSPSDAAGWNGCTVTPDNHTVVYKRQGFPTAFYQIDLNGHDDGVQCYVNGNLVYQIDGCCADRGVIWSGVLCSSSTVEFRVMEGGGGSNLTVDFIDSPFTAGNINGTPTLCPGATSNFTSNGNSGGVWSSSNTNVATVNPSTGMVTAVNAGSATITYTVSNAQCGNVSANYNINVNSPTAPTASGTTISCGQTASLTASGAPSGGSYVWFDDAGGTNQVGTGASYTTPALSANTTYYVGSSVSGGAPSCNSNSLANVLSGLNSNQSTISSSVPNGYNFNMDAGVNSNYISDGGSDMYDGGNYISTNFASNFFYSDGTITNSGAFGTGSSYFTKKINNMLVLTANMNNVSNFTISGNNGADGGGSVNGTTLTVTVGCQQYTLFLKRVWNAGDPSINQMVIIPSTPGVTQTWSTNTDDSFHQVSGLNGVTRMYYLLYASANGSYLDDNAAINIANTFLNQVSATISVPNVCISSLTPVSVTVNPLPGPTVSGTTQICNSGSTTLTATGTGNTIEWYADAAGTQLIGTGNTFTTPALTSTTIYYVSETASNNSSGSQTFNYTGGTQNWTVPAGVSQITIDAYGAQGFSGGAGLAGLGGRMQSTHNVTVGQTLSIYVGGRGTSNTGGGWNGGATTSANYTQQGRGGGASDVRQGGTALSNRIIVAGGGGGAGYNWGSAPNDNAGNGGGSTGGRNNSCAIPGAPGYGGTQTAGGAGGVYSGWANGFNGTIGDGGAGAPGTGGGGGGGGYYGGGGGSWSGGGGGSSYSSGTILQDLQGVRSGDGQITISWSAPACTSSLVPVTVTVSPQNTISQGQNRTVCQGSAMTTISLATTGATGATVTGLPSGLTGSWSGNFVTISGTPIESGTFNYNVATTGGCPPAATTGTITVDSPSTSPTITPIIGTVCPNTNTALTASGGVAGTGSTVNWYTGPNGTGSLVGTGTIVTVAPTANTTYYVRREGTCNTTTDASVTVNVKNFVYATNGASSNTYCTDNSGWNHFYNGDDIIFSVQGDLSGAPSGYPIASIAVNNAYYQQTQGPGTALGCSSNQQPGEERFEMERSWNVDMGGGIPNGTYNIRFYYQPEERTAIEDAAVAWLNAYPSCGYSYKYNASSNGFFWFKNSGSNYVAPMYENTQYSATVASTADGINYAEWTGINGFSGGSGAIILQPITTLPVELIAFTAHCQIQDVEVKWSTASEFNSQYFTLQVSEDGYDWSDLYVAEAAEFSNTVVDYTFVHQNAARTKQYYRLLQYDNDGAMKMYNTIMANCSSDEAVFMTFPNPSADAFTVVVNDKLLSGSNVLNITDASGKLIYSIAVDLENGSGSFAVEGLNLPAGLYYLQLNNGSYASRIIKHSFR